MKNKYLIFIGLTLLSFASVFTSNAKDRKAMNSYGEKIKFQNKKEITLPDFSLKFIGERRVASVEYPRGFLYYDFDVSKGDLKKTISWTSGTGDIAPLDFEFSGRNYFLELGASDIVKPLGRGELIVWEEEEFKKRTK